jgi:hypothetical protein
LGTRFSSELDVREGSVAAKAKLQEAVKRWAELRAAGVPASAQTVEMIALRRCLMSAGLSALVYASNPSPDLPPGYPKPKRGPGGRFTR